MSTTKNSNEYVLTTSSIEDDRLKRQHDLWLEDTLSLWKDAQLNSKQSILELGCGPGYNTHDLARYLGPQCDITAIELSPQFAGICAKRMKDFPKVRVLNDDIHQIILPKNTFDVVYARWICMFLPRIEDALKKVADSIKPGGIFVCQEYVDYGSTDLSSRPPIIKKILEAIIKSFSENGGTSDVVKKIVPTLTTLGFKIEKLESRGKLIQPSDPFWDWPSQFYQSFLPTLESTAYLQKADVEEFNREWKKAEVTPGSFWVGPTVAHVIARKI